MRFAIRIIINIEKCIAIKYTIFMNDIVFELNTRLKNNQERQKAIEKSIEFLPKGHINVLNRNGKGYYYLTYREGNKVKNEYLGPEGRTDLNKTINRLKERKIYDSELKELKKEEKTLKKLLVKAK